MTETDSLRRFIFEEYGIRGVWIHLSQSLMHARLHQQGNQYAHQQFGQALAAVAMLSTTIKFKGSIILQVQGNGPLKTLVAQSSHERKIRGLIRSEESIESAPLQEMFGDGRLVLTIEPENSDPYQGIVPLHGVNLAFALQAYFEQSEQIRTRFWLFATDTDAGGLMIQELPNSNDDLSRWDHLQILADTVTENELLRLDSSELLRRLFFQENIRLFDSEPVEFGCSCSSQKLENALMAFKKQELEAIISELGHVEGICEFCNKRYQFHQEDIDKLFASQLSAHPISTLH